MRRFLLAIGVIIVLAIVGWAVAGRHSSSSTPQPSATIPAGSSATISYDDSGFHPATTTVKSGDSVTFVNNSSSTIQVDSNPHPIHTDDTDLNVGTISAGQSQTVVLIKKGTFGFHNHLNPSKTAQVTVE